MESISPNTVILYSVLILSAFFLLFFIFWISWKIQTLPASPSPYTGVPLRRASDLSYFMKQKIASYLFQLQEYDNRPFAFEKAAYCRETERIFQECVTWYGAIRVGPDFLQKRLPGHYVSWGSLSDLQKENIREKHNTLEGFQTDISSPDPSPTSLESKYIYTKPGPLYVDPNTGVLIGWKVVPDTGFEVLIVQRPKR